ncbi:toprim domain-containing protein [Streptomyces sp. MI02-2A]|uniref:toprim domain-containing protein n=1 Tax=Streptomyces sp. MI02-2A TaxID=3028688 RepID=UPI0029B42466|nr:toprim domain-containing protein [Streptomyces sp. MI02-2A]MDX3260718.1 toprim domain-containing protein [Streptomyces sp. MI02-2A]
MRRAQAKGWDAVGMPTPGNVTAALDEIGLDYKVMGDEIHMPCPMHEARTGKPDKHPSFSINSDAGYFNCFSCGYRGPFVVLVKDMLEIPHADAVMWVRQRGGIEKVKKFLAKKQPSQVDTSKQINEASLALYVTPPIEACGKRMFLPQDAEECGVLWDTKRGMWIIPVRCPDTGTLWGWQEKNERYFRNRPPSMTKSQTLFGLHSYEGDLAILVESPLDVVRLRSAGYTAGLAAFGAGVSDAQMRIIRDHFDSVIIALDNDKSGTEACARLREEWTGRGLTLRFLDYSLTDAKDPGEMSDQEITDAVNNAYSSVLARF